MIKKERLAFLLVVFGILMINGVAAISTDLRASYSSSETAVGKILGNILEPINPEQIEFKRNNVRVPFEYDIKKLGEEYFIWFNTPNVENMTNYTLIIHDISTTISGSVKKIDFGHNFSVTGQLSDYYIKPGFIYTKDNFDVQVILNRDINQKIDVDFPSSQEYKLQPGINNIPFLIKNAEQTGLIFIHIGKYEFPAYLIVNGTNIKKKNYLSLTPYYIESARAIREENIYYQINVQNLGTNEINNIYLQFNDDRFSVDPNDKINLKPNESATYQISFESSERKNLSDIIYVKSDENNVSISLPVHLVFVENVSQYNQTNIGNISNNQTGLYTCSELLGQICSSEQACSGETKVSSEGICCTGICTNSASSSGSKAWVGYLVAAIVVVGVLVLYVKYKKVKPEKNPMEKRMIEDDKKSKPTP